MALLAPTFNRLNIVKRLKKWNHQTYSPFPSPFPYSNFLLTSRLSISSDHSVSRNYPSTARSKWRTSASARTNANVRYLFNEASTLSSCKYPTSLATSLSLDAFYGRTTRVHLFLSSSFHSLFFSFLPFLFLSFSRGDVTPSTQNRPTSINLRIDIAARWILRSSTWRNP